MDGMNIPLFILWSVSCNSILSVPRACLVPSQARFFPSQPSLVPFPVRAVTRGRKVLYFFPADASTIFASAFSLLFFYFYLSYYFQMCRVEIEEDDEIIAYQRTRGTTDGSDQNFYPNEERCIVGRTTRSFVIVDDFSRQACNFESRRTPRALSFSYRVDHGE